MFEEIKEIDRIEIVNFDIIQVRRINKVYKNGIQIAASYSRISYMKDQSMIGEDPRIISIAKAIWPGYDGTGTIVMDITGSAE